MTEESTELLHSTVVLDLTDEKGLLAGKLLADLGANVIKVEPPEGCTAREVGPFCQDGPGSERSLLWSFCNTNKRSITINLFCKKGRGILKKLVEKTDILIESYPPGEMEELEIGYEELAKVNPRLVYTSITPFGRTGPYCNYEVTDLVAMAMGGNLYLTGDQDRPPIPIGYPQAYFHAGAEAAVASLVALYHKEMTGVGQLVDVSIQESLLRTTFQSMLTWNLENLIVTRLGSKRMWGKGLTLTMCWPCKDGYVLFTALVGPIAGRMMKALGKWMGDEGFGDAFISGTDWESISAVDVTTEDIERTAEAIEPFFANYTKKELFEKSIERDIMLFPVSSAQDILSNVHLAERHFWQTLQQPELEDVLKYPKPPFQIDGEYPTIRRRAPRIGEHNAEVYGELLSLAPKEVLAFEEEGII